MTRRDPIQHAADTLIAAVWWLDRRLPARCAVCREWIQWRNHGPHGDINHPGEV